MDKLIDIGDKVLNIYNSSFNLLILFIKLLVNLDYLFRSSYMSV